MTIKAWVFSWWVGTSGGWCALNSSTSKVFPLCQAIFHQNFNSTYASPLTESSSYLYHYHPSSADAGSYCQPWLSGTSKAEYLWILMWGIDTSETYLTSYSICRVPRGIWLVTFQSEYWTRDAYPVSDVTKLGWNENPKPKPLLQPHTGCCCNTHFTKANWCQWELEVNAFCA